MLTVLLQMERICTDLSIVRWTVRCKGKFVADIRAHFSDNIKRNRLNYPAHQKIHSFDTKKLN